MFDTEQIAKRQRRDGFTGVTYTKKPLANVQPNRFLMRQPTFPGEKVNQKTAPTAKNRPSEETIERQRFLDGKPQLAGKRNVSSYEDRTQLRFDPMERFSKEKSGYNTYDSGRYQSGTRGDKAFMTNTTKLPEGRGQHTTLERQDPYRLKLPSAIYIRQ